MANTETPSRLELLAPVGFPEVLPGINIAREIARCLHENDLELYDGDVLVVAQKVVSKAEGRMVSLSSVSPGSEALALAGETGKDPHLVQLILDESESISRRRRGLIIARHRLGFVCANAGIDHSNVSGSDYDVLLLPVDPSASAARIRQDLAGALHVNVGVIINDSHGRPFRNGAVGVAIGWAGVETCRSYVGEEDRFGHTLRTSVEAVADELAAAATLVMGQSAEGRPFALVRGGTYVTDEPPRPMVRERRLDLYK